MARARRSAMGKLAWESMVTAIVHDRQGASGKGATQHAAGGAAEPLRFALGESTLGALLLASGRKGIVALLLGDDPARLARELRARFPDAEHVDAGRDHEPALTQALRLIDRPHLGLELPLDLRGTAFQQRIWLALRAIPAGRTLSYAELSRRVGSPGATRAVASACAANSIAVAVPCHRVVRSDGALAGYAWGIERKRALLAREAAAADILLPMA